jgi:hypothetical protein
MGRTSGKRAGDGSKRAQSEWVKQVFVRHAFRVWMVRNEIINDAAILQDAYRAHEGSGGSMKALLTSLVMSDAFLFRKVERSGSDDLLESDLPTRSTLMFSR